MAQYRFVGTHAQIFDTPYIFTRFGQLVDMPDDIAAKAIEGGVALLPASEFDALEFSADDLKKYATVASHDKAPEDFKAKRNSAWAKVGRKAPATEQQEVA